MWRFWKQATACAILATAVGLWCSSPAMAKKPGGGGTTAPYTLVDLLGFTVTYPGGTFIQSAATAVNEPDGSPSPELNVFGAAAYLLARVGHIDLVHETWDTPGADAAKVIRLMAHRDHSDWCYERLSCSIATGQWGGHPNNQDFAG